MTMTAELVGRAWSAAGSGGRETLDYARLCLLDWLGVTVAGSREPVVEILVADCETLGDGHTLLGRPETASLRDAVLINGAAGHALDYDDGMPGMSGHPSVGILPSLLMLAAHRKIGGERLLRAIVAGSEAAGRIGLMLGPDHYARGFHATGTVGAMAGALAAAWLVDLPRDRAAVALGLAGTRAAGLKGSFGTDGKPLHAAWAALIAHSAVSWAEKGMTGPSDLLGHTQGIRALTQSFQPEAGLCDGGVPHVRTINFKYHAACAVTHPGIDLALSLKPSNSAAVVSVLLEVAEAADNICNIAEPQNGLELKFSLRGVTAMALAGIDTASPESFGDAPLADPEVRRLMACTKVRLDPALTLGQTRLSLGLADGTAVKGTASLDDFERDPAALRERLGQKFESLVAPLLGETRTTWLADEVLDGSGWPEVARLVELLHGGHQ